MGRQHVVFAAEIFALQYALLQYEYTEVDVRLSGGHFARLATIGMSPCTFALMALRNLLPCAHCYKHCMCTTLEQAVMTDLKKRFGATCQGNPDAVSAGLPRLGVSVRF